MRSFVRLGVLVLATLLIGAGSGTAEDTTPRAGKDNTDGPTLARLREQVEELTRQLAVVKKQLADLAARQTAEQQLSEVDRLRAAAMAAASEALAPPQVDTSTQFVSGTRMQPQLNPEISLTGNMFGIAGTAEKERFSIGEWELDVQSYLDPFSRVHLVLAKPEEESVHLEEGYVTWLQMPAHTSLTVGKKRQQFGVLNRWHPHAYDQVDAPWVLEESFGEEGLIGTGISVDWLMPHLWADANELTVEVSNGDNDVAFAGADWKRPTFLARLKSYWDLTHDSYLEVGLNGLQGCADPDGHRDHRFAAADLTYNWYPSGRELYHEVTVRGMLLHSRLDLADSTNRDAWGGYLYGQFKLSQRWTTGLRFDWVDDQRHADHHYWGLSPYLTLWQSEFVRMRGQMSYRRDSIEGVDRRFLLQLTVAAGPHKHETY